MLYLMDQKTVSELVCEKAVALQFDHVVCNERVLFMNADLFCFCFTVLSVPWVCRKNEA